MSKMNDQELKKLTNELVMPVRMLCAAMEADYPDFKEMLAGALIREFEELRGPSLAAVATRKAMLSQPMAGKSDEEIVAAREKAVAALEDRGYTVINTLFSDEWYDQEHMKKRGVAQVPLCFLAKSLENMSLCHAAYFCKGWEDARGCRIEHAAAEAYGLEIIYEE